MRINDRKWLIAGLYRPPTIKDDNEKNKFHQTLKKMCTRQNKEYYKKYKKWCDEYFYLQHRNEARGIGGIFFDYKKDNFDNDFKFVRDVGVTFQLLFNKIILISCRLNQQLQLHVYNLISLPYV